MSEVSALVHRLIELGVDPGEAAEIVTTAALEGASSVVPQRTARQARNHRYYEKRKEQQASEKRLKASETSNSDGRSPAHIEHASAPGGDNPSSLEPTGEETKTTPSVCQKAKPSPRSELGKILDSEHADAVIDHRQRLRKPLTARAAKLLADKFAQCPDPNAAADAMIGNGWQGFEPEWLDGRGNSARSPPQRQQSMSEQLSDFTRMSDEELFDDPPSDTNRSDTSNAQGAGPDPGHAVRGVSERTWRSQEQIPRLSRCVGR